MGDFHGDGPRFVFAGLGELLLCPAGILVEFYIHVERAGRVVARHWLAAALPAECCPGSVSAVDSNRWARLKLRGLLVRGKWPMGPRWAKERPAGAFPQRRGIVILG